MRACGWLNAPISRRVLGALCAAVIAAMLAPLFALAFYAHPTYDDFPHVLETAEAWARTGSVWVVIEAAWNHMLDFYAGWQGTFVAMFSSALQPMAFGVGWYWLTPVITLLLLCLSLGYLVKALVMGVLKAGRTEAALVYAALLTLLLQGMPGMREAVYWQSGTPYTLSVVALATALGLLIKLDKPQGRCLRVWRVAAACVCGVVLGASTYPLALGGAVGAALVAAWCFARRSSARWGALAVLMSTAGALLLVVLAPGNAVRQARVGESLSPVSAVAHSVLACLETTGGWLSPLAAGAALMMALAMYRPLLESGLRFRHPFWFGALSLGVLAACYVPPIYATGADGYGRDRILASLYMLFSVLLTLNALYLTGWLAGKDVLKAPGRIRAWQLCLCAGLMAWGLFSLPIQAVPSLNAAYNVAFGHAAAYDQGMTLRENALADAATPEEAAEAVVPLEAAPALLPYDSLLNQLNTSMPWMIHRQFCIQRLVDEYGPGQIPDSEWEKLDE